MADALTVARLLTAHHFTAALAALGVAVAVPIAGFNTALAHELRARGIAQPVTAVPLITRTLRSLHDALTRL